jgi:hypothetical protein
MGQNLIQELSMMVTQKCQALKKKENH